MAGDPLDTEPVESVKADAVPKSAPKPRKRAAAGKPRGRPRASVELQVTMILSMAGTGWQAADPTCGGAFMDAVPGLASAINLWAQQDKRIYDWIMGTTAASGPLSVAVAIMPVVQAVAIHHVLPVVERRREIAARNEGERNEERLRQVEEYVDGIGV